MLLKGGQADGALDILGNDALGDRVEMREMPARLLTATAGVGVGELFALHVGSPQRYEYVVWGDSLQQTARAAFCHAQPGECLASQEVFALAGEDLRLEPKQAVAGVVYDAARQKELEAVLLLKGVKPTAPPAAPAAARAAADAAAAAMGGRLHELLPYIPGAARALIQKAGVAAAAASRDARDATVLVLKMAASYKTQAAAQRTAQAVRAIQQQLYRHEAAFVHFVMHVDGAICVTAFGLPPFTLPPSRCARRATAAAQSIRQKLDALGVWSASAVVGGHVVLGCLPSPTRIDYVLLGRPVALATQAVLGTTPGGAAPTLVDDICFQATKTSHNFSTVQTLARPGGGSASVAHARPLLFFALTSSKASTTKTSRVGSDPEVRNWLQKHGRAAPQAESKLSVVATRELRECFEALDRDGNDAISISELRAVLRQSEAFAHSQTLTKLFDELDADGSGLVTWEEFFASLQKFTLGTLADVDEVGSGSLGENIRLLLLAHSHRVRLVRTLGAPFQAKYASDLVYGGAGGYGGGGHGGGGGGSPEKPASLSPPRSPPPGGGRRARGTAPRCGRRRRWWARSGGGASRRPPARRRRRSAARRRRWRRCSAGRRTATFCLSSAAAAKAAVAAAAAGRSATGARCRRTW